MKIESTNFTTDDLRGFLNELIEEVKLLYIERLTALAKRLSSLRSMHEKIDSMPISQEQVWNARETLAHIAVFTKFYGVVAHRMMRNEMDSLDLLSMIAKRDELGSLAARKKAEENFDEALSNIQRTLEDIKTATPDQLRTSADFGNGVVLTAEDIIRLPYLAHLEMHIKQLEQNLQV
jgi:regulator of replication initiation timing